MLFGARTEHGEKYREEGERLPKETEKAIACLSMRELADQDLKDILSSHQLLCDSLSIEERRLTSIVSPYIYCLQLGVLSYIDVWQISAHLTKHQISSLNTNTTNTTILTAYDGSTYSFSIGWNIITVFHIGMMAIGVALGGA
jgi:hypothetical protein